MNTLNNPQTETTEQRIARVNAFFKKSGLALPQSNSQMIDKLVEAKKKEQITQAFNALGQTLATTQPEIQYANKECNRDPGDEARENAEENKEESPRSEGQFSGNITLNADQQEAVRLACDFSVKNFAIYGSAGTGKTTLLRAAFQQLARLVPQYGEAHKHLAPHLPAIAVVSYTRRSVKNLKRALAGIGASDNCITIHKLLEYAPEYYSEIDEQTGNIVDKMRFAPMRRADFKLTNLKCIIIDEAGMCSVPLFQELLAAAPTDCRFIFLGDIYQLPPIYGSSILGYKLADAARNIIPKVELTKVYRQALDSPILRYALQVKDGKCPDFKEELCRKARTWKSPTGDSELSVMPIADTSKEAELLNIKFGNIFKRSYLEGRFNPEEDVVLIPHGKPHTFGSYQLSLHIAQGITEKNNLEVYEVFAGYNKHYLCIGDKVTVGSIEGRITRISRNAQYYGKITRPPSRFMNRWGQSTKQIDESQIQDISAVAGSLDLQSNQRLAQIESMLASDRVEDRKTQASHIISVMLEDTGAEVEFNTAGEINSLAFTYALTCHRAQGAEWRNVYIILHHIHAGMYSREWLYTAMTRAREKCIILARPAALEKCTERAVIKGTTLAEKAEFFKGKQETQGKQLSLLAGMIEGDN